MLLIILSKTRKQPLVTDTRLSGNPVPIDIDNIFCHTSLLKIKQARNSSDCLSFKLNRKLFEVILDLGALKDTQKDIVQTKMFSICLNKL